MTSLDLPTKTAVVCVELRLGDPAYPTYVRLTDAASRVSVAGDWFDPEPALGVELEAQTGSLDDKSFRVFLPLTRPESPAYWLAEQMDRAEPLSPVSCRVLQVFRALDGSMEEVVYLAEGDLGTSKSNPDGKEGVVELEFAPAKASLKNTKLGIPANGTCGWTYGRTGCYKNIYQLLSPADYYPSHLLPSTNPKVRICNVEMTFPEGRRSQVVSLSLSQTQHAGADQRTLTSLPRGWWINAYLTVGGLSIPIRDWWWNQTNNTGSNLFVLGKVPPSSWAYNGGINNFLLLVPGCTKTKLACTQRENTLRWGAFGFAIPAYNPLLDAKS
jgi:hypothetical protein